ncbi:MAG: NADH-quinone oxidoreductase subunit H [Coriobacteriia bacterium]|nr:NADH-quinone oxidoreductase subunit H [Coriobacteriia bacterium]
MENLISESLTADLLIVVWTIVASVIFAIIAPIVGCLFAGIDRKISARMQGRVGPPILQPYYDFRKLMSKEKSATNGSEGTYLTFALIFVFIAGGVFIQGGNILLSIFIVTLASLLFIMAAYSSRSPYAEVGASREILQVMAYEPIIMLFGVGVYFVGQSFNVGDLFMLPQPIIIFLIPVFVCFVIALIVKFRKSPFDISMSHHAHQEIVRGMTTEMSGPNLAKVEIMHWSENFLFIGWILVFFISANPVSIIIGIIVAILVYLLMIWIDNNFARVKWQSCVKWLWILGLVVCGANFIVLMVL